jgi:hypothetical protein
LEQETSGVGVVTKPHWIARNKRDREAMYRFVDRILDDEDIAFYNRKRDYRTDSDLIAYFAANPDGAEIEAAWRGDIEPLRAKYPKLAPFLAVPALRARNERDKAWQTGNARIASYVKRIQAIWKLHYGHIKRPEGQLTAPEIAARRLGLDRSAISRYAQLPLTRMDMEDPLRSMEGARDRDPVRAALRQRIEELYAHDQTCQLLFRAISALPPQAYVNNYKTSGSAPFIQDYSPQFSAFRGRLPRYNYRRNPIEYGVSACYIRPAPRRGTLGARFS